MDGCCVELRPQGKEREAGEQRLAHDQRFWRAPPGGHPSLATASSYFLLIPPFSLVLAKPSGANVSFFSLFSLLCVTFSTFGGKAKIKKEKQVET